MNSRRLRHEMAMLLDFLHIGFKFTTTGHTGEYGHYVSRDMSAHRSWTFAYILDCIQKKKFDMESFTKVYPSHRYSHLHTVREAEMIVDRLFQPDIGLQEFTDLSWAMNMQWSVPCDSHQQIRAVAIAELQEIANSYCPYYPVDYHPYEYIRVHAVTRTLDLDAAATPQVLLDLLRLFVVNKDTLAKKALQRLRKAVVDVEVDDDTDAN